MTRLAALRSYKPKKNGGFELFFIFLQKSGFTKEMAEDLLGWQGVTMALPAAEFAWLDRLTQSKFQTPEDAADLENRLMAIADGIRDKPTSRQYRLFFREKLRNFYGFDYRQRAKSNVIPIRRKADLLGSLANLERMTRAADGMASDGGSGDAADYLRDNIRVLVSSPSPPEETP